LFLYISFLGEAKSKSIFPKRGNEMFEDKYLVCKDCGSEFLFSASEQEFYAEKGFENEPGRCPDCRRARKQQRNDFGRSRSREDRPMFKTVCAACGQQTTVPFEPSGDRPVYCRECFQARQSRNNYSYR
jgi:CxxC-x17-CxxC domain-containing protein